MIHSMNLSTASLDPALFYIFLEGGGGGDGGTERKGRGEWGEREGKGVGERGREGAEREGEGRKRGHWSCGGYFSLARDLVTSK